MVEKSLIAPPASSDAPLNERSVDFSTSTLEQVAKAAIAEYGVMSVESQWGEFALLVIGFANEIVEDVRTHPYWDGTAIHYYMAVSERRAIPDTILKAGIKHWYSFQQGSKKTDALKKRYFQVLNQTLFNRKYGNVIPDMRVMDGGSNPAYAPVDADDAAE